MGQYHLGYSYDPKTNKVRYIHPYHLGSGLKAWEQIGGHMGAALAILISAEAGEGPADLAAIDDDAPAVLGAWAGTRILWLGDYCENADIQGWDGPPLADTLCRIQHAKQEPPVYDPNSSVARRDKARARWRLAHEARLSEARRTQRWLPAIDDSPAVARIIEAVRHLRFTGNGWRQEEPAPPSPSVFDLALTDKGQSRLVLNLDRGELLDPRAFGAEPTTAGMVRCSTLGDAMIVALLHHEPRGGGDLPPDCDVPEAVRGWLGRWRADRLVAAPEDAIRNGASCAGSTEARAPFRDLSALAKAYVEHLRSL